jgi:DNA-directed RNA polymerase specialized sigma24 family protein
VLVMLTARKAGQLARNSCREKRGGGKVLLEGDLAAADDSGEGGLAQAVGREPTPAFAAQAAEELRRLLDRLEDPDLRAIALWRMEGYTTDEIAARLGCVPRTVERRLRVIRTLWGGEGDLHD